MSENRSSILGHFRELRNRLIFSVIAVVITTTVSFIFAKQLFDAMIAPAVHINLSFTEMTEMFGTYVKVCFTCGIILAMPFITIQFLMFVAPALTHREKKYVYLILPWIGLMFIGGVVFGYFFYISSADQLTDSLGMRYGD